MDSMSAFAMGEANRNQPLKVFDWNKAAKILKERNPDYARAGLQSDMFWTSGCIWEAGKPVPEDNTYTYLASTWAIPILVINGEEIPCYIMEDASDGWGSGTYWPQSALEIIK